MARRLFSDLPSAAMKYFLRLPRPRHSASPTLPPLLLLAALGTGLGTASVLKADPWSVSPDAEPNSPQELNPALAEPGLSSRALPSPETAPASPDLNVQTFNWITHPFDNSSLLLPMPAPFSPEDPSLFRPVVMYTEPLGLRPQIYRSGILEWYPWAGVAQSFESNIQLTPHNQISDFYFTPRFGFELQLGTPDSIYNEGYDTVFAAHLSYEGYADLFYDHPGLNAYNQRVNFSSRIGRDDFIVRPFMSFSDVTGSNLQMIELENRTERLQTTGGVIGEYDMTPVTAWRQTYTAFDFEHHDRTYINYDTWSTRQELTYLLPNDTLRALVWAGAKTTDPSAGNSGNEYLFGAGWQGHITPRLDSEIWLGWGAVEMNGYVPNRENLSGVRFDGHTTFNYSSRLRITLIYNRDYVFNEFTPNDNYVSTLAQLKLEVYLGSHWFLMPYFGCSYDQYETSRTQTLEIRPELELCYVFPKEGFKIISRGDTMAGSRVFLKLGYDYTETLRGSGDPIPDARVSTGVNWNF
jgi:hypothetical protein